MCVKQLKLNSSFFLMHRTIERIYPYYVKAPSDSNSKPIKQLLSGKSKKESFQKSFKLSFIQLLQFAFFSLYQATFQFSFPVWCNLKAEDFTSQRNHSLTQKPWSSFSFFFIDIETDWLKFTFSDLCFCLVSLLTSISNHICAENCPIQC